jgi:hypothetical protein
MKNIHILPTDKPSRLFSLANYLFFDKETEVADKRNQHIYITSDEKIKDVRPHKGKWQLETGQILNKFPNYLTDLSECKLVIMTTDQDLIKDGVQAIDDEFLEWFVKNPSCEEVEIIKTAPIRPFGSLYKAIIHKPTQQVIDEDFDGGLTMGQIIPKEENKKYPIGGYAPGFYTCNCITCKQQFMGDKRAVQCESCAIKTIEESKQETLEKVAENESEYLADYDDKEMYQKGFIEGAKWQEERSYSEEEVKHIISEALQSASVKVDLEQWFEQFKKK